MIRTVEDLVATARALAGMADATVSGSGSARWLDSGAAVVLVHAAPSPPTKAVLERLAGKATVGGRLPVLVTVAEPAGAARDFVDASGVALVGVYLDGSTVALNDAAGPLTAGRDDAPGSPDAATPPKTVPTASQPPASRVVDAGRAALAELVEQHGRDFSDSVASTAATRFTCPECAAVNPRIVVDFLPEQVVCSCNATLRAPGTPAKVEECDDCRRWSVLEDIAYDRNGNRYCVACIGPVEACDLCGHWYPTDALSTVTAGGGAVALTVCDYSRSSRWYGIDAVACCADGGEAVAQRAVEELRARGLEVHDTDWWDLTSRSDDPDNFDVLDDLDDFGPDGGREELVGGLAEIDGLAPQPGYE